MKPMLHIVDDGKTGHRPFIRVRRRVLPTKTIWVPWLEARALKPPRPASRAGFPTYRGDPVTGLVGNCHVLAS